MRQAIRAIPTQVPRRMLGQPHASQMKPLVTVSDTAFDQIFNGCFFEGDGEGAEADGVGGVGGGGGGGVDGTGGAR